MKNSPFIFADKVKIALSTVADGDVDVRKRDPAANRNAREFLQRNGFDIKEVALVRVTYDRESFTDYAAADETWAKKGILGDSATVSPADGVATATQNLGLFLPLADCLGAVIYDPVRDVLAVAHLGRHATEANGVRKTVEFLSEKFDANPADLKIWLSPSAGAENYPLYKFENKSLHTVNTEHFIAAGVRAENIIGLDIDTTRDANYFSHSMGDTDKRFAIVARMI